jgi:hypothetical protein
MKPADVPPAVGGGRHVSPEAVDSLVNATTTPPAPTLVMIVTGSTTSDGSEIACVSRLWSTP